MNLNRSPSLNNLKKLFESCDDYQGHHVLWVSKNGDVAISIIPNELTPVGFDQTNPDMVIRYETFSRGNGYVGLAASNDNSLMDRIFRSLLLEWSTIDQGSKQRYVDIF